MSEGTAHEKQNVTCLKGNARGDKDLNTPKVIASKSHRPEI